MTKITDKIATTIQVYIPDAELLDRIREKTRNGSRSQWIVEAIKEKLEGSDDNQK